jgi:hypothetical protein
MSRRSSALAAHGHGPNGQGPFRQLEATDGGPVPQSVFCYVVGFVREEHRMSDKPWQSYERLTEVVFQLILFQKEVPNLSVERNVTLKGKTASHEVDICWRFELGGVEIKIIVQTKNWDRPVEQLHLLAFKEILNDLPGQPRGIFVTRSGYQKGAKEYALAHDILLYELREAEDLPMLGITPGGWATFKLVPMPLRALITSGEPDMNANSATALGFDQEVFTPHYSGINFDVSKSWLEQEYPDQDTGKMTTFRPAQGPHWHDILLYDDGGAVVGNLGVVLAKLAEVMRKEGAESKRVTYALETPASILTSSSLVPRVKVTAVSADVEIKRSRALRRGKMSNFQQLELRQLNSNQTVWFAVTKSVLDQITAA